MKGFIKVIDIQDKEHYINVNQIIKFAPADQRLSGNSTIRIVGGDNTSSIQTSSTCDEIMDMVELALN